MMAGDVVLDWHTHGPHRFWSEIARLIAAVSSVTPSPGYQFSTFSIPEASIPTFSAVIHDISKDLVTAWVGVESCIALLRNVLQPIWRVSRSCHHSGI